MDDVQRPTWIVTGGDRISKIKKIFRMKKRKTKQICPNRTKQYNLKPRRSLTPTKTKRNECFDEHLKRTNPKFKIGL